MGYAISAYRVNLERVESRLGIADKPKRRKIINRCAARAASIDELGSYKTDPPEIYGNCRRIAGRQSNA